MKDDSSRSSRIENVGYTSKYSPKTVGKLIGNIIEDSKRNEEQRNKQRERVIMVQDEKGYTSQLTQLGKLCCFVEKFDMISLEEQNIGSVGPFEDPRITKSFKNGYTMAESLVKAGFNEASYRAFVKCYEDTFNVGNSRHK